MKIEFIDVTFNLSAEVPEGKDTDAYSKTLRSYHKILWSRQLPNGHTLCLNDDCSKKYLYGCVGDKEVILSSDAIAHSYRNAKRLPAAAKEAAQEISAVYSIGRTIGAYILYPARKVNGKMTVNCARGIHRSIVDRFDLTLECIRLFYDGKNSPLYDALERYRYFFEMFVDFRGYVDFFLLQDLTINDYTAVRRYIDDQNFTRSPFPLDRNEYCQYAERVIEFVQSRNQRIDALQKQILSPPLRQNPPSS